MTVKSGQVWSGLVVCTDATGALATPSAGPAGALYVDGTVNAAAVTISGANPYKWTVTLPALTAGQCVSMYITATIATIATASVVAEDVADTVVASDNYARLGAPAGASVSADVAAVKVDTAATLVDTGTTLDALIKDIPTVAEFEARTLVAADYVVVGDTLAAVTTVTTTTNLTNLPAAAATAAELAKVPKSDGTASWNATALAAINAEVDTALADYDPPTNTELEARTLAAADYTVVSDLPTVPSAATIADAVWNEAIADHAGAGSTGAALAGASAPAASAVADAVWDELLSGHVGVGSAGAGLAAAGSAGDPWSTPLPGSYGTGTAGQIVGDTLGGATGSVVYTEGATLDDLLDELDTAHGAGSWEGVGAGVGTGSYTDTITDGADPLDGVRVQLSTDSAGASLVYEAYTDALGVFTMRPDPGTYYRWLDLAGYTFTQGVEVTVT